MSTSYSPPTTSSTIRACPEARGPEGTKRLVSMILAAFPDAHYTLEDIVAEGDKVAYRWSARATHKGEFMGIAATGKQGTVRGTTIVRIMNGKFQEAWQNWDALGLMHSLGWFLRCSRLSNSA